MRIDALAECVAAFLWEVVSVLKPKLVYCGYMLNDGKSAHTYDDIISIENLLAAWKEFVKDKRKKADVQAFQLRLMDNILSLHREFVAGTYRHGPYEAFKVNDPKPRDIHKATVRDRLVHHAIYRVLYPIFDRTWVADSFSCRRDKGTHRAMNRFHIFARKVSRNETRTCWVLKCDVRKFFASIDQKILMEIVTRRLSDTRSTALVGEIVKSFYSTAPGKGLPLGNLTSQMLVNLYMNEFDQYAKHGLKCRYYIRYADDFVLLSDDRTQLEEWLPQIAAFLGENLALSLHPGKVYIKTYASGVDFLGWVHFMDHRILRTSTKRRIMRALSGDVHEASVASYLGLLKHGNAYELREHVERVAERVWGPPGAP